MSESEPSALLERYQKLVELSRDLTSMLDLGSLLDRSSARRRTCAMLKRHRSCYTTRFTSSYISRLLQTWTPRK